MTITNRKPEEAENKTTTPETGSQPQSAQKTSFLQSDFVLAAMPGIATATAVLIGTMPLTLAGTIISLTGIAAACFTMKSRRSMIAAAGAFTAATAAIGVGAGAGPEIAALAVLLGGFTSGVAASIDNRLKGRNDPHYKVLKGTAAGATLSFLIAYAAAISAPEGQRDPPPLPRAQALVSQAAEQSPSP